MVIKSIQKQVIMNINNQDTFLQLYYDNINDRETIVKEETGETIVKEETGETIVKEETGETKVKEETGETIVKKETGGTIVKEEIRETRHWVVCDGGFLNEIKKHHAWSVETSTDESGRHVDNNISYAGAAPTTLEACTSSAFTKDVKSSNHPNGQETTHAGLKSFMWKIILKH